MKKGVVYLDEPVIFEWTEDRPYIRPIFTSDMLDEPIDILLMRERLTKAVEVSIESLNEHTQVIERGLNEHGIRPPFYYTRDDEIVFRIKEYLTRKYNKMMISKNNYVISMLQNLLKDIPSLCRLIQVFPFLKYRIEITDQTCTAVLRNIRRCENDFLLANESSTRFLASVLEMYEVKLEQVCSEPAFSWPFPQKDEMAQLIFDAYVLKNHSDIVTPLLEKFSPEAFPGLLESCVESLISRIDESAESCDVLTLYVCDFVFARVDIGFARLDEPYNNIEELRARKVRDFDLPTYFRSEDELDLDICDFVAKYPELTAGADSLTMMMFEWSPTNILLRVNESLAHVQAFLISKMKASGQEVANFVSFDETFSAFTIALLYSNVANLRSIVEFACTIVEEGQLTNNLGFAQTTLRGVYEYIESVTKPSQ